jgi:hypothetical protein
LPSFGAEDSSQSEQKTAIAPQTLAQPTTHIA